MSFYSVFFVKADQSIAEYAEIAEIQWNEDESPCERVRLVAVLYQPCDATGVIVGDVGSSVGVRS